ncbi:MAG: TonB-dependent receptor [Chitinophagaceae bacterium]
MKKIGLLVLVVVCWTVSSHSQNIKGKLLDLVDNKPLSGARVTLRSVKDTLKTYNVLAGDTGTFRFQGIAPDSFFLSVHFIGYEEYRQIVAVSDSTPLVDLGTLFIPKTSTELDNVVVTAKIPPTQQKGDTVQYNASQFKVNPDANVEDLIKKAPGITVDRDGTVTAHGEQVRKVTIDGRDFFGDDASAALRNLPAEVVDKIQVFDRLSDQARFTGFDDGNTQKSINIVTKSGIRNSQFGRMYAGIGTDGRYSAGGNVSFFNGDRRISVVGLFNNVNQQNFGSQDLLGVSSSGGNRGGGSNRGGSNNRGGGGSQNNFTVSSQPGISRTNAGGINFADNWGKKLEVTGSYFFNQARNTNEQENRNQSTFQDTILYAEQYRNSASQNYNHRINLRLEYKIDSANEIIISPSLNFQDNKSWSNSSSISYEAPASMASLADADTVNTSENKSTSLRTGYNLRNNILYRHAFAKRGRSISVNLSTAWNKNDGESYVLSHYRFFKGGVLSEDSLQNQFTDNATNGYNLSSNIAYTEPMGRNGQLQINYSPSYSKSNADQYTFRYDPVGDKYTQFDSTLSNVFENTTITHNGGVSFRIGNRDNQLSAGVNVQHSRLQSDRFFPNQTSVDQAFTNLLPNLSWRKKISARSTVNFFYRASTSFPSVTQLQDVVNINNPLRVTSGNPSLKQSYSHYLSGRYTFTNTQKGQSFFANIYLQATQNNIASATFRASSDSIIQQGIELKKGSQLVMPVNLDGYQSVRTFFTYGMPVAFIKSNINVNTGFSYSRMPGLANSVKSITNNYTYNAGIVVASNISEYIDFNLSYNRSFNVVKNSIRPEQNSNYNNGSAGIQVNVLTKSGWFVQNDVSNQSSSGLSSGFNQSFWLWNAAIGKKFLKNRAAELRLSVFDLLKENQSITRTVSENYIEDSRSNVLQQYFILTFTYNLKNFGTAKASANPGRPGGGNMRGTPRF